MKALLIENSRLYVTFLTRLFRELYFEPVTTSDMQDARRITLSGEVDLVCMNLYQKGSHAIDFVQDIRSENCYVPVLMLTSDRSPKTRANALGAGITEIIYKSSIPAMADTIGEFVRKHLQRDLHRGYVLYVEDSRTEAAVTTAVLKSLGLRVDHFNNAEEAFESFKRFDYDLVISDVLLKGEQSGLSLVGQIRNLPEEKARIPVLTVTGFDDVARRIELLRAGTNDCIVKPVVKEELTVRVTNLINNKQLVDKVIEQQTQLYELSITDPLTGCYNRRGFRDLADNYMKEKRRHREPVSLLMIDLDHFKAINDKYGHDAGDKVLAATGDLLNQSCRDTDLACRIGGEEFLLFLPGCSKPAAVAMAQGIRRSIEELRPDDLGISTSIGVTTIESGNKVNLDVALTTADRAVYRAKARGRNCVSFRSCSPRRRKPAVRKKRKAKKQ